ncbi:hypothetical protein [Rosettibacter firmus]|uniref:hypothetical protein n=1 Tax=Rosettibacter firmus TaxID=3111522 RepID=UPI00336BBED5
MITLITSIGTSLISKFNETKRKYVDLIDDMKDRTYDEKYIDNNKYQIDKLKSDLISLLQEDKSSSAEVISTLKLYEKLKTRINIIPIVTDTLLSNICSDVISEVLPSYQDFQVSDKILVKGLQVYDNKKFLKEGMPNLINKLEYYSSLRNVYLNFTGGYKGVIPYLTLWAQVNNIKMIYLYEESNELIEIPQAPIDISWSIFHKYYHIIQHLKNGIEISKEEFLRKNNLLYSDFPDIIDEISDGEFHYLSLNSIGLIFLNKFERYNVFFIPVTSQYFSEEQNNKSILNKAISTLINRLNSLDIDFNLFADKYFKHTHLKDNTWIYKYHNNDTQIRIHYKYENMKLTVYNYKFIRSRYDDNNYSTSLAKEYEILKNSELISIPLQKEI